MNAVGTLAVLSLLACAGGAAADELRNPFARPAALRVGRGDAPSSFPLALQLRATLVAGRLSSANIDGHILRLGEEVGGYRLISVDEGMAVLVRDGATFLLAIERPEGAP